MTQTDIGAVAYGWWAHLTNPDIGQPRAALAQLRRASAPIDALLLPAVHDLNRRLAKAGFDLRGQPEKLALIAMVLAQVKTSTPARLAQLMGRGDPKTLSPMRFDRLMRLDDPQELAQQLRRADFSGDAGRIGRPHGRTDPAFGRGRGTKPSGRGYRCRKSP